MMKLQWPGFYGEGTVIIELTTETFSLDHNAIEVCGTDFTVKSEFHVTLIGEKVGAVLLRRIRREADIETVLKQTFESIDWSFRQCGPVYLLSRNQGGKRQKSIIMLIDMPGLTEFYQQLKTHALVTSDTPVPPAHITLYTHNCPLGIGVPDDAILKRLTKNIFSLEEFRKLEQP